MDNSRIIMGCANFGGVGSIPDLVGKGNTPAESFQLLDRAKELGLFRFDTANSYSQGASENILGEWIQRQPSEYRSSLQISTKVGNPYGATAGKNPLCKEEVEMHLDKSLRKLGVETFHVYYLHVLDPNTPIEETLEAISKALQSGKIQSFGISNVSLEETENVVKTAGSLARSLSYVQNEFHYINQDDKEGLIPYLNKHQIKYASFGPLAGGMLTGKYLSQTSFEKDSRLALRGEPYERYQTPEIQEKIRNFVDEAKRENITPSEKAIQFIFDAGIDSVIIGPRRLQHFDTLGVN